MTRIVIAVAMPRKLGSYIDEVTPTNSIDAGKICVHISFCKTPPHECINELCSLCKPYGIAHCYAMALAPHHIHCYRHFCCHFMTASCYIAGSGDFGWCYWFIYALSAVCFSF